MQKFVTTRTSRLGLGGSTENCNQISPSSNKQQATGSYSGKLSRNSNYSSSSAITSSSGSSLSLSADSIAAHNNGSVQNGASACAHKGNKGEASGSAATAVASTSGAVLSESLVQQHNLKPVLNRLTSASSSASSKSDASQRPLISLPTSSTTEHVLQIDVPSANDSSSTPRVAALKATFSQPPTSNNGAPKDVKRNCAPSKPTRPASSAAVHENSTASSILPLYRNASSIHSSSSPVARQPPSTSNHVTSPELHAVRLHNSSSAGSSCGKRAKIPIAQTSQRLSQVAVNADHPPESSDSETDEVEGSTSCNTKYLIAQSPLTLVNAGPPGHVIGPSHIFITTSSKNSSFRGGAPEASSKTLAAPDDNPTSSANYSNSSRRNSRLADISPASSNQSDNVSLRSTESNTAGKSDHANNTALHGRSKGRAPPAPTPESSQSPIARGNHVTSPPTANSQSEANGRPDAAKFGVSITNGGSDYCVIVSSANNTPTSTLQRSAASEAPFNATSASSSSPFPTASIIESSKLPSSSSTETPTTAETIATAAVHSSLQQDHRDNKEEQQKDYSAKIINNINNSSSSNSAKFEKSEETSEVTSPGAVVVVSAASANATTTAGCTAASINSSAGTTNKDATFRASESPLTLNAGALLLDNQSPLTDERKTPLDSPATTKQRPQGATLEPNMHRLLTVRQSGSEFEPLTPETKIHTRPNKPQKSMANGGPLEPLDCAKLNNYGTSNGKAPNGYKSANGCYDNQTTAEETELPILLANGTGGNHKAAKTNGFAGAGGGKNGSCCQHKIEDETANHEHHSPSSSSPSESGSSGDGTENRLTLDHVDNDHGSTSTADLSPPGSTGCVTNCLGARNGSAHSKCKRTRTRNDYRVHWYMLAAVIVAFVVWAVVFFPVLRQADTSAESASMTSSSSDDLKTNQSATAAGGLDSSGASTDGTSRIHHHNHEQHR